MEIWKKCECVESESKYEISNFGNCRRKLLNGNYKVVKGSLLNRGPYRYFQVLRNKKRINYLFHHLVARYFIGKRPEGLVIDHIDRNSLNNNVNNLRYVTHTDNMRNTANYLEDIEEKDNKIIRRRLISIKYREANKEILNEKKEK